MKQHFSYYAIYCISTYIELVEESKSKLKQLSESTDKATREQSLANKTSRVYSI